MDYGYKANGNGASVGELLGKQHLFHDSVANFFVGFIYCDARAFRAVEQATVEETQASMFGEFARPYLSKTSSSGLGVSSRPKVRTILAVSKATGKVWRNFEPVDEDLVHCAFNGTGLLDGPSNSTIKGSQRTRVMRDFAAKVFLLQLVVEITGLPKTPASDSFLSRFAAEAPEIRTAEQVELFVRKECPTLLARLYIDEWQYQNAVLEGKRKPATIGHTDVAWDAAFNLKRLRVANMYERYNRSTVSGEAPFDYHLAISSEPYNFPRTHIRPNVMIAGVIR